MRCWVATADFETRSRANLKKAGAWRYSVDPSTKVLCLGYALDSRPRRMWKPGDPDPVDLFEAIEAGAIFEAHNSFFEWCIWHNVMVARHGWPELDPNRVVCIAARAAYACLPRNLDGACYHAGLDVGKSDDKAMKKLSKPRKPTKKDKSEWHEDPELYRQLYLYCDNDVLAEQKLSDKVPALSPFERRVFLADARVNLRGLRVDVEFVEAALKVALLLEDDIGSQLRDVTRGKVTAPTQRDRIIAYLEGTGLDMPTLDIEAVEDMLYYQTLTKKQRRVLELRREGNRSSVSKYKGFGVVRDEDVVRGLFLYYGANAHGRWSGKLIQPQNFPRGDTRGKNGEKGGELMEMMVAAIKKAAKLRDPELLRRSFTVEEHNVPGDPTSGTKLVPAPPAEVLSTALRGAFVARPGKTYGVGDYKAIELCVLFWFADEKAGLKILLSGGDVYRDMGSVIFGKPPEELDVGFERMMGKTTVLGCGYSMAWRKFQRTCKKAYGMILSDDLCKRCVDAFRKRYRRVPKFWYALEGAAKKCIKTGAPTKCGLLTFRMERGHLKMRLPSGRDVIHRHARLDRNGDILFTNGKGWTENTYGGKLTEYACSGTARDFLADAMVKAEFDHEEIDVVMHSHDELVVEGDEGEAAKVVKRVMENVPEWGKGCPITIETWEGPRYHK